MPEKVEDYGEPWVGNGNLYDQNGLLFEDCSAHDNMEEVSARVCALVNAFAGVPTSRLEEPSDTLTMFKAWMAGDDDAASVAADMILEKRQAEAVPGFVSRADLLRLLRECKEYLSRPGFNYVPTTPAKLFRELEHVLKGAK